MRTRRRREEEEKEVEGVAPETFVDSDDSSQNNTQNVWEEFSQGFMHSLDKISSFADEAIQEVCQEGEIFVKGLVQLLTPPPVQNTIMTPAMPHSRKRKVRQSTTKSCSRDKTKSKGQRRTKGTSSRRDEPTKKHTAKKCHRRTMSRRLHPSALDQNDFPWY